MSENVMVVSDANFATEVVEATLPVLVDFWAEWCGPCKVIAPVLEEIAAHYQGKIKVAKLNIEQNNQVPVQYEIRAIPTLLLFKNGEVTATQVGALTKSQLTAFIDSNL